MGATQKRTALNASATLVQLCQMALLVHIVQVSVPATVCNYEKVFAEQNQYQNNSNMQF